MEENGIVNFNSNYRFRSSNLKRARTLRRYSITDLAEALDISQTSLSGYENGKRNPSIDNLNKIAKLLDFPVQFFYTDLNDNELKKGNGFFRKYSRVPKRDREAVEELAFFTWRVFCKMEAKLNFPKYNGFIQVEKSSSFKQIPRDYIENVAKEIRKKFDFGNGPLINLTGFMESQGIILSFLDLGEMRIDAYTNVFDGTPIIILNSQRISSSRIRFNLAHELAHLLFHIDYLHEYQAGDKYSIIEEEANYFAGCLLLPEDGLRNDLSAINMQYLITLKQHWVVSVGAIITRSEQCDLISSEHALHLRQQISRNGWRKKEPLDDELEIEKPVLLESAMKLIESKIISLNQFAHETSLSVKMLNEITNYKKPIEKSQVTLKVV